MNREPPPHRSHPRGSHLDTHRVASPPSDGGQGPADAVTDRSGLPSPDLSCRPHRGVPSATGFVVDIPIAGRSIGSPDLAAGERSPLPELPSEEEGEEPCGAQEDPQPQPPRDPTKPGAWRECRSAASPAANGCRIHRMATVGAGSGRFIRVLGESREPQELAHAPMLSKALRPFKESLLSRRSESPCPSGHRSDW